MPLVLSPGALLELTVLHPGGPRRALWWLTEESFEHVRAVFMERVHGLVCYGPKERHKQLVRAVEHVVEEDFGGWLGEGVGNNHLRPSRTRYVIRKVRDVVGGLALAVGIEPRQYFKQFGRRCGRI